MLTFDYMSDLDEISSLMKDTINDPVPEPHENPNFNKQTAKLETVTSPEVNSSLDALLEEVSSLTNDEAADIVINHNKFVDENIKQGGQTPLNKVNMKNFKGSMPTAKTAGEKKAMSIMKERQKEAEAAKTKPVVVGMGKRSDKFIGFLESIDAEGYGNIVDIVLEAYNTTHVK